MPTTSDLLADWRATAEAATEGPWEAGDVWVFSDPVYPDDHRLSDVLGTRFADAERAKAEHERGLRNAAFIADARTAVPALLSAVEAVLALHRIEHRFSPPSSLEMSFDSLEEAMGWEDDAKESIFTFDVCAHCGAMEMGDDSYDKLYRDSMYPCATVRAVSAALGTEEESND